MRLVALAEDSNNYRYDRDVQKLGFFPSLWMNIGNATDLTLSYYYLKSKDVTDYGQPSIFANGTFLGFPNVSPKNYYGYANHDFADYETHIATFRLDHQFNERIEPAQHAAFRELQARVGIHDRDTHCNRCERRAGDALDAAVTASRDAKPRQRADARQRRRRLHQSDRAHVDARPPGSVKHTVLTGLELAHEKLDRRNYILDANPTVAGAQAPTSFTSFLAPDPSTRLTYTKTPNLDAVAEGDTVALYAQDQLELSPHWKALLGLRYEHFKATARTVAASALSGAPTGPFSRTDDMLSGRAGLIWQPTKTQSYYVS